jgi:hypothetical protein
LLVGVAIGEVEEVLAEVDLTLDEDRVVIVDSVVELLKEDVLDEETLVDGEDEDVKTRIDDDDVLGETGGVDEDPIDDDGVAPASPGTPPMNTKLSPVVT